MVALAQKRGVNFIGCQLTMDVLRLEKEDFVDGMLVGGAFTFLDIAKDADVILNF